MTNAPQTLFAQVVTSDTADPDSAPNNNPGPARREDDEAAVTVN